MRLIYDVGIYEQGRHSAGAGGSGNLTRGYKVWFKMIERCYSPRCQRIRETYRGLTVDERFHKFQDFMDWAVVQKGFEEGFQLDKDLLVRGNRVYGPDTCLFLPMEINNALKMALVRGKDTPQGVHYSKRDGVYVAHISMHGVKHYLGSFTNPQDAFEEHKKERAAYLKRLANTWRESIDKVAFEILSNYEVREEYK